MFFVAQAHVLGHLYSAPFQTKLWRGFRTTCKSYKASKLASCVKKYIFIKIILLLFILVYIIKENEQRKIQEEKMERRKKEREASLKKSPSKQGDNFLLLFDYLAIYCFNF